MAKIYPIYKASLDNAPEVQSEKKAYAALAQGLPDDYTVLYGVEWTGDRAINGSQDYECDFVITHPQKGLMVVEVKGGGIRYDGQYGQWQSQNHKGIYKIKDPIKQARRNKYGLKNWIISKYQDLYKTRPSLKMAHCAWFIDTNINCGLPPNTSPEMILTKDSIDNLHHDLEKAYAYFDDENNTRQLRPDELKKIISLLVPTGAFTQSMSKNIQDNEKQILQLTEQQYKILKSMRHQKRVFLSGGAGTGKTLLGLEKMRAEAVTGKRVLYTCYSRPVAETIQKENQIENAMIINFHKLCHEYAEKIGKGDLFSNPENLKSRDFWNKESVEILEEAIYSIGEDLQFDTIIVDEVQDFSPHWLECIKSNLLKNEENGCIYFIGDRTQAIFEREDFQQQLNGFTEFELHENLRNTKQIFQSFSSLVPLECQSLGPTGQDIKLVQIKENTDLFTAVNSEINKLISERVKYSEIVVLSGRRPSSLFPAIEKSSHYTTTPTNQNQTLFSTIHSYKGLESPIIILTDLTGIHRHNFKELLYVAFSRAKFYLIIIGDESEMKMLNQILQTDTAA
jgi:hypothetical protein